MAGMPPEFAFDGLLPDEKLSKSALGRRNFSSEMDARESAMEEIEETKRFIIVTDGLEYGWRRI